MLIKNAIVYDYKNEIHGEKLDLLIENGRIKNIREKITGEHDGVFDARGLTLVPGLVDMHAHVREPGQAHKETIETASASAAKGGVTTTLTMPNTKPPLDSPETIRALLHEIKNRSSVEILATSAMTRNRAGAEPVDFRANMKAGCSAFSDDGSGIQNPKLMIRICEAAKAAGALLLEHPEFETLSLKAPVSYGRLEKKFGLKGQPAEAESLPVLLFGSIAGAVGARIHFTHLSTARSLEAIMLLKKNYGGLVTCDCTPHHLALADTDIRNFNDTNKKIHPPLRPDADRIAVLNAIKNGVIDAIATDHAPHTADEKSGGFAKALPGSVGFETLLPVTYTELVMTRRIAMAEWVKLVSYSPSRILGIQRGEIRKGARADLALFDPRTASVIRAENIVSKSKNSAFLGRKYHGIVKMTLVAGKPVYRAC